MLFFSCAVRDAGFDACPIDHKFNKHKPKMPIANFDLYVLELLNSGRVFAVHVGPLAIKQVGQRKTSATLD